MKAARLDTEVEIAQDLGALSVTEADIGKLDHRAVRSESIDGIITAMSALLRLLGRNAAKS